MKNTIIALAAAGIVRLESLLLVQLLKLVMQLLVKRLMLHV